MMHVYELILETFNKNLQIFVKKQRKRNFQSNHDLILIIFCVNDIINDINNV